MEAANRAVVQVLADEVLNPRVTDLVVRKAMAKFKAAGREWAERQQTIHKQITAVDAELVGSWRRSRPTGIFRSW